METRHYIYMANPKKGEKEKYLNGEQLARISSNNFP